MIAIDSQELHKQAKSAAQQTARVMGWKFKTAKMKRGSCSVPLESTKFIERAG